MLNKMIRGGGVFREYQYVAIPPCYTRSIRAWLWS